MDHTGTGQQPRDLCLTGGSVVTDGRSARATIYLRAGLIAGVDDRCADPPTGVQRIDVSGLLVLPGVVNGHAHGCTTGPLFSSAAAPLVSAQVRAHADRHLSHGVTTLVNVCGFGLPEDIPQHPLQILLGTTHLPAAVAAAETVDGAGLDTAHRSMTAERMLESGAVVLGEIGSGATLGGGVAAYRYLPQAITELTGREISPEEATALIDALVGPLRNGTPDSAALQQAMGYIGLPAGATTAVRDAVLRFAAAPVAASLRSFDEAAAVSQETGAPAVFHTAEPSVRHLLELARNTGMRAVAGHMNHTSMQQQEAVEFARLLRAEGTVIDVSSLDIVDRQRLATPEVADALMRAGVVDTLSTDYAGGRWESMLGLVQRWISLGIVDVPTGVALCTSTPAAVLGLNDRGSITPGKRADIVCAAASDLAAVDLVFIGGREVYRSDQGARPEVTVRP